MFTHGLIHQTNKKRREKNRRLCVFNFIFVRIFETFLLELFSADEIERKKVYYAGKEEFNAICSGFLFFFVRLGNEEHGFLCKFHKLASNSKL